MPKFPVSCTAASDSEVEFFLYRPYHVILANSIIYCNSPGTETGFMAMGYPKTAISIDQTTEELIITLRMYLGAGIINP